MTADKLIALFVVYVVTSLTKILPLKKPWGRSVTGRDHKFVTAPDGYLHNCTCAASCFLICDIGIVVVAWIYASIDRLAAKLHFWFGHELFQIDYKAMARHRRFRRRFGAFDGDQRIRAGLGEP